MRPFFPRIRGGARDNSAVLADLLDYHAANPAVTERTLGALRTREGKTGYDLLVDRMPSGARAVLDLGCGNGPLLRRLLHLPLERVVGVDLCESDLVLARTDDPRLTLLHAAGQSFDARDLDAVLSHHAFYLMDPIEPVITNIARALRPGGLFAFVTSSPHSASFEPWASMMRAFSSVTKREHPGFRGWGDPRVWTEPGLHELLDRDFTGFTIEDFVLVAEEAPEALADRLLTFFYSAELQSDTGRAETHAAWVDLLRGTHSLELPWAIVSCTRR